MSEDTETTRVFHALSRHQALLGAAHLPAMCAPRGAWRSGEAEKHLAGHQRTVIKQG